MSIPKNKKISIPFKILDLLWSDDNFYSYVEKDKRVTVPRFPRMDQYCDDDNFYMSFALAGYSPESITILVDKNVLTVKSIKLTEESQSIQQGLISRGIAQRRFEVKYSVSSEYNLSACVAKMRHGLLRLKIPKNNESLVKTIDIIEEN